MLNLFQIFFLSLIGISFIRLAINFRKENLLPRELLFWILVWGSGAIVIAYPVLSTYIGKFFGIERGADFIIYSATIFIYYILYRFYLEIENLNRKFKELSTKIALSENDKK